MCCLFLRDTDLITSTDILRPRSDRRPIGVVARRHVTTHLLRRWSLALSLDRRLLSAFDAVVDVVSDNVETVFMRFT